jgi:hypothetical protein
MLGPKCTTKSKNGASTSAIRESVPPNTHPASTPQTGPLQPLPLNLDPPESFSLLLLRLRRLKLSEEKEREILFEKEYALPPQRK